MSISNDQLELKTTLALMGCVVEVDNENDVKEILQLIGSKLSSDMTAEEMYRCATEFIDKDKTEVYGISCSTICNSPCVNIIFRDKQEPFDIGSGDGVLAYVLNFGDMDSSELGYTFFQRKGNYYHRVA